MAGLFDGMWGNQGNGVLPSGSADFQYPDDVYARAVAQAQDGGYGTGSIVVPPQGQVGAYAPGASVNPQQRPMNPFYAQQSPQQPPGFFDRVNAGMGSMAGNPLVMFGLGLASGRTPQEGLGNAASSLMYSDKYSRDRQAEARQLQGQADTARALTGMGLSPDMAKVAANNPELLKIIAPELYTKPTWGVIGENPDQTKRYGWIDPRQQTVREPGDQQGIPGTSISRPPITGPDAQAPAGGVAGVTGAAAGAAGAPATFDMPFSGQSYGPSPLPGAKTDPYKGLQMGLTGQALYDSLPSVLQNQVQQYLDGRLMTGIRSSGEQAYVKKLAVAIDPTAADDTLIAGRRKFRTELESSSMSTAGGQYKTGKTALKHLAETADTAVNIGNQSSGALPIMSEFSNAIRNNLNEGKKGLLDAYESGAQKYAGESMKYYSGSQGGGQAEREQIFSRFGANKPPEQQAALLQQEKLFLLDKLQTQEAEKERLFGPKAKTDPKLQMMDADTVNAIKKIDTSIEKLRAKAKEGRYFNPTQPTSSETKTEGGWTVLPNGVKIREK